MEYHRLSKYFHCSGLQGIPTQESMVYRHWQLFNGISPYPSPYYMRYQLCDAVMIVAPESSGLRLKV